MQHCGGTQGEVSHYSDMFTVVTSVRALTNCEMFVLEADDFREVVQDFPGACEQLRQAALRWEPTFLCPCQSLCCQAGQQLFGTMSFHEVLILHHMWASSTGNYVAQASADMAHVVWLKRSSISDPMRRPMHLPQS